MSKPDIEKIPESSSFDRAECIRGSVQAYTRHSLLSLGLDIEQRYLGTDIYALPNTLLRHSKTVDELTAVKIAELGDPGESLTDEKLEELAVRHRQAREAWGTSVMTYAKEAGLVRLLTAEEASAQVITRGRANLAEDLASEHGIFSYAGWGLFQSTEGDSPMLLIPTSTDGSAITFEAVELDDIHTIDPTFLPTKIVDTHVQDALSMMANTVTYNLLLHEVAETDIVPPFMAMIANISDERTRIKETTAITEIIKRFNMLGHDYHDAIYQFHTRLNTLSHKMTEDARYAYLTRYIDHIATCRGGHRASHDRANIVAQVYNTLISAHLIERTPSDNHSTIDREGILKHPTRYTIQVEPIQESANNEKSTAEQALAFIETTSDYTSQDKLLSSLKEEMPEFYAKLIEFQEWLGLDYSNSSNFDRLVDRSISNLSLMAIVDRGAIHLKEVYESIGKALRVIVPSFRTFDGIYIDTIRASVNIYDQHLSAILPLLVLRKARNAALDKETEEQGLLGDMYRKKRIQYEGIIAELVEAQRKKADYADKRLQENAAARAAFDTFQRDMGITSREIQRLRELVTDNENLEYDGRPTVKWNLYGVLFNLLVLSKEGRIDMQAPSTREFLGVFFPHHPASVWGNL